MSTINDLNTILSNVFKELDYNSKFAFFQYSDRPDLSDFQTNCAMPLCKELHKNPREVAESIVSKLKDNNIFDKITIDGPGFINVVINNNYLIEELNKTINDSKCGLDKKDKSKNVIIDFGGYNIAKEPHVGHLRSTVIGESIRKIYNFCGDNVLSDVHLGDWGLQMGMVIEGIRLKYPEAECFKEDFNKEEITDLSITPEELTELYRLSSNKSKEDKDFNDKIHKTTKKLQDGYKPYITLWKYFTFISINDLKDIAENILNTHFDFWNGESSVNELSTLMIRNLIDRKFITKSDGAEIIDISDIDDSLPPVIMKNSEGALMYATTDIATILDRVQRLNANLILYIVDARQSLHFKQVFLASKKISLLDDNHKAEHCPFGTMNGKDNKPFKTRSGDNVKLRDLINEVISKIKEKSKVDDEETIKNIAVACLKFADLINYRESNYIFDMDQFTSYEGKTGAYILYSVVRINSILNNQDIKDFKITDIRTKEEKDLLLELSRFSQVVLSAYDKKAPNFIAEYVYNIAKKFNAFYSVCPINNEKDEEYKKSKLSLIYLIRQYIVVCLDLLGIKNVNKM